MKQIEVQIMGQNYLLACSPESEAQFLQAVEQVDTAMCKIRDAGKVKARDRIAVLAALNLAFEANQEVAPQARSHHVDAPNDAEIEALIAKIDQALAGEGQLL